MAKPQGQKQRATPQEAYGQNSILPVAPPLAAILPTHKQESNNELVEYRNHLVQAQQKAQEDYDKAILALSGGALGLSMTFVKDLIGSNPVAHKGYLLTAWVCWGVSLTSILYSYYTSVSLCTKGIAQVDAGIAYQQPIGGWFRVITRTLNFLAGFGFLIGLVMIVIFAHYNWK
jgi:hypothetical protein